MSGSLPELEVVLGGVFDEGLEAAVGAEGAVGAVPGEAGGDFAGAELHAADGVGLAVGRQLAGEAGLEDDDFAGEALKLALSKADEPALSAPGALHLAVMSTW
jgi:hypothetical protein